MESDSHFDKYITGALKLLMLTVVASVFLMAAVMVWVSDFLKPATQTPVGQIQKMPVKDVAASWRPPDMASIKDVGKAEEIKYGKELISHTARYLGPKGSVMQISNGMNCQNCHLDAGTKIFGNNYGAVASTYPKFRARSGSIESVEKRVNDCFERSLNGRALDTASREMRAIVAYIQWLGSEVRAGEKPQGAGLAKIQTLERAADPARGKQLYESQCIACHGKNGEGVNADGVEYQYPPLWGDHSYNRGAGLFRLSNFAQFIHKNMPLGASFENPILSEEESWDIAAYVNSLPRPNKDLSKDWPRIEEKPFDHPFGPYADPFSEQQHKYGPYKPIVDFYAKNKK